METKRARECERVEENEFAMKIALVAIVRYNYDKFCRKKRIKKHLNRKQQHEYHTHTEYTLWNENGRRLILKYIDFNCIYNYRVLRTILCVCLCVCVCTFENTNSWLFSFHFTKRFPQKPPIFVLRIISNTL